MASGAAAIVMDLEQAKRAIAQYNSSQTLLASDRLMHIHFASIAGSLATDTIAERVVLLDGLWATRLFMESGSADRIVKSLQHHASKIVEQLQTLAVDALESDPSLVVEAASNVLPAILSPALQVSDQKYRQNYSFATKFFHWTSRHHFPIVDSRARSFIHGLQQTGGMKPCVRKNMTSMNGISYVKEYGRWVCFYSEAIRSLRHAERIALLDIDLSTQPKPTAVKNSLLRVLDKVFYTLGGGTGVGRISASD